MADLWMDVNAALSEVPINLMPIVVAAGTTIDDGVTYNEAGLDLNWNFITTAGAFTQTNVTPTDTEGVHDFVNQGNGMYTIEIPATGGTINNDTNVSSASQPTKHDKPFLSIRLIFDNLSSLLMIVLYQQ